jgi:hypothetical protein
MNKKIIKKIIRESIDNMLDLDADYKLKKYIIDSIEFEGYDGLENIKDSENIQEFYNIFLSEKLWHVKQVGVRKALEDYLRGMPSAIDLPTYYYNIRNLLYAMGFDGVKEMEDEELDKFYYKKIVDIILNTVQN